MSASTIAPTFTGFPGDWPRPYYCDPTIPPRPYGWQCVVWAAWRYHQLTGTYPPFGWGNALTWTQGAKNAQGWSTSSTPVVPSIACLQPGVDGAFSDGHVAIVEQINTDGSVLTSNMNWGVPDGSSDQVEMVTHKAPQNGLAFLYLTGTGATQGQAVQAITGTSSASSGSGKNIASLNALVSSILLKIGVPQAALDALNIAGFGGVNVLTLIGLVLLGGVVLLIGGLFTALVAL
jgi:surface antigen